MKKMNIYVENPCHEDWQNMTPETQGRFCGACEKTVVDFSEMSDAEILLYFSKPKIEKVCGRFRPEQLSPSGESATPRFVESIVSQKMPSYPVQPSKQLLHFAYLLVMVLGVGVSACGDAVVKGEVKGQVIKADTSADKRRGEPNDTGKKSSVQPAPKYIKGKVARSIMGDSIIIQIEPEVQDVKIMGECVMPIEYERQ